MEKFESRPIRAEIDLNALQHNIDVIKQYVPNSKIMAVIKADAYGHGVVDIAKALTNCEALGVTCLTEALDLRQAGIRNRIIIMQSFYVPEELPDIFAQDLEVMVHNFTQIDQLQKSSCGPIKIWPKINTGMNRFGFKPHDYQKLMQSLASMQEIKIMGLMTHLSSSSELDNLKTERQIELFEKTTSSFIGDKSVANSAAIMTLPGAHTEFVRPGAMLYGMAPFPNTVGAQYNLQPVMRFKTKIIAIQQLRAGDKVGYGETYTCPKDMSIGVLAVGYGDGYPREAPNGTPIYVRGKKVPLVAKVTMDTVSIDLSSIPEADVGDDAILWGPELPIEEVATYMHVNPRALTTGIAVRVPKEFVGIKVQKPTKAQVVGSI